MMRNSAPQVFAGGWKELQHGIMTENEMSFGTLPKGHFIRPDGVILFTTVGTTVESVPFSIPWIIDTPIPAFKKVFNVTEDSNPRGITFSPDGTIMVIVGRDTENLYSYVLPIPWDITSIVDVPTSLSLSVVFDAKGCEFSRDGDFIFVADVGGSIRSFLLPIPYDITSNVTSAISPFINEVGDMIFKPEGDMMYVVVEDDNDVREYILTTPYDITTAVFTELVLNTGPDNPTSVSAKANGMEFFVISKTPDVIMKFHLEDEWHIATGSRFQGTTTVPMGFPVSITWKPDGTKFYILNAQAVDEVLEFSVPFPFNLQNATQDFSFPINPPETNPRGMFFHPDGSMFWIMGTGLDDIIQFNLTTPWDLSTAFNPNISINPSGLSPNPQGLFFGKRGLKAYITDSNDDIMEYDMTTPYDITTLNITPVFSLDISTNTSAPRDVVFHPNGTIMYIISDTLDTVSRYVLTTSWDISSAVFVDSLDVSIDTGPQGLFIRNDDGKKLYMVGTAANTIYTWDMSLDFSIPVNMAYEDGNIMDYEPDWISAKFLQRIPRTIQVGQIPSAQTDFTLLINNTFPDMIGAVEAEIRFAGPNNIELEYYIQEFDTITGKLIARVIIPTAADGDVVFIYFDNNSAIDEQDPPAVWTGMDFVYPFDESTSTVNNLVGVNSTSTGTTQVDGKIFKAINFANNTQFVAFTNPDWTIQRNNESFSMAFWYKSTDADRGIFCGNFDPISADNFNIEMHTSRLRIFIDDTSGFGTNEFSSTDSKFMDGEWHLLVFTYSGVSRIPKIYFDGVLEISAPARPDNSDIFFELLDPFYVSRDSRTTVNYVGDMELFRKFNNLELDADTISAMYNNENDDNTFWSTGAVESVASLPTPTMGYE